MATDREGHRSVVPSQHPEPQRTCIGCRGKGGRSVLLRITTVDDGTSLVLDSRKVMPGRGAWLHPDRQCLEKASTRRAWQRALRRRSALETDVLHEQIERLLAVQPPTGGAGSGALPEGSVDHDRKRV